MSADSLIPTDEQIECERAHRKQQDAAPPLRNPLPATVDELRAECERHRGRIVAAMRDGLKIHHFTDANFSAFLTGKITGFLLPPFDRLFDAALVLDLGDAPAFQGEPQSGRDAVTALDKLAQWCRAKQQPAPAATAAPPSPAQSKRRGGKKKLSESNPAKADLYEKIVRAYEAIRDYGETVTALKRQHDIMTLARQAGVAINSKTVRCALEWWRLFHKRQQRTNKI